MLDKIFFMREDEQPKALRYVSEILYVFHGIFVCKVFETKKFALCGKTFDHKDLINSLGGKWDKTEKAWVFTSEKKVLKAAYALVDAARAAERAAKYEQLDK